MNILLSELDSVRRVFMTITAIIYARQSADYPLSAEDQVSNLRAIAAERGWTVARVFIDQPTTAKRGRNRRPGQTALIDAIRLVSVERVLLHSIDRMGRSLAELVGFIETCRSRGVALYIRAQALDTQANNGLSIFDLAEMMALHLRQSRRDRILRGQAIARAAAVRFGRPSIPAAKVERAKQELAAGKGVRKVARLTGISPASCSRIKSASASSMSSPQ
jgi:DNA invertase Pin-like site-specific DNA recombinase